MAVTVADVIDPAEEPVIRPLRPKPFPTGDIDPAKATLSYDRRSDTLLIHLFGREHDAVSVQAARHLYLLVDSATEDVVGFQVEGVLAGAIAETPQLLDLLDHAELRGITPAEVRALWSDALAPRQRLVPRWRRAPEPAPDEQKRHAVSAFIDAERARLPSPPTPAVR